MTREANPTRALLRLSTLLLGSTMTVIAGAGFGLLMPNVNVWLVSFVPGSVRGKLSVAWPHPSCWVNSYRRC